MSQLKDEANVPAKAFRQQSFLIVLIVLVTAVQALATFSVLALPTLATRAAPSFGFGAEAVGYQISVVYIAGAVVSGIAGLIVRRRGAAMASCVAMLLSAAGLAAIASGRLSMAILASALLGMAYGLTNPAASHLLFRFAPRDRQNLIFALKQTGVPLGGMLAAMLLPRLDASLGWQWAMLIGALLLVLLAVPLWLLRPYVDDDRDPNSHVRGALLAGVRLVLGTPQLRAFALMGAAYASAQFCLFAFLITMLVEDFGWTLVAAGGLATVMQLSGAAGRIAWSMLADRIGYGVEILIAIGILSSSFGLLLAFADSLWPVWLISVLLVGFGFCLIGWNGLWLAEIARAGRPQDVSLATGGILCFTFFGIVLGPSSFALVYKALGSYSATYGVLGLVTLLGVFALVQGRRWARRPADSETI